MDRWRTRAVPGRHTRQHASGRAADSAWFWGCGTAGLLRHVRWNLCRQWRHPRRGSFRILTRGPRSQAQHSPRLRCDFATGLGLILAYLSSLRVGTGGRHRPALDESLRLDVGSMTPFLSDFLPRSVSDEAIQFALDDSPMDCFAALAMTGRGCVSITPARCGPFRSAP